MSSVIRIALVDPEDSTRESLKSTLLGIETIWLEAECSRYDFFADVIDQTNPDVGIVVVDSDTETALSLIGELKTKSPDCGILVLSSVSEGQVILNAMRSGAKEFLTLPVQQDDLLSAVERICTSDGSTSGKIEKKRSSQVIAVCGATGSLRRRRLGACLRRVQAVDECSCPPKNPRLPARSRI